MKFPLGSMGGYCGYRDDGHGVGAGLFLLQEIAVCLVVWSESAIGTLDYRVLIIGMPWRYFKSGKQLFHRHA
jgi:hypothetical protein